MNYFAFSALVNLVASLTLFIMMTAKTNRTRYDTWFAGFCFSTMIWSTGYFFWQLAPTHETALFWTRFLMGGAIIVGLTYLQFVLSFLGVSDSHKKMLRLANGVYAILFLSNLGPSIVRTVEPRLQFQFWPVPGNLFHIFLAIWGLSVCYSTYLLYKAYIVSAGLFRRQIRLLFFGMAIAFVSGSMNYLLWYNIPIAPVTNIFVTLYPLMVFYAIAKYKFFNTRIIAAEMFALLLIGASIWQFFFARTNNLFILNGMLFLTVFGGVFLIRSVHTEALQREMLQKLSTELENANMQLKNLDQARAEFISIASHQLRTPPATVKWYLSAVLGGDYGVVPKEIGEILKKTEQTNNHLISLIEDMLNVSRIERGKMEFLFESTNVEELAQFAYEQLIPMATDKKLKLIYASPRHPLPRIMADKEKLRQVMNNLIDNAIKYTKQGEVTVKIFQKEDTVQFEVKDSGKGISPADQKSIFQKFTRGKESIKQSAGLGLGLYVAKIIIEQHKGKIWSESPGEGKGSTFIFSLPIHNDLKQTTLVDLGK